MKYDNVMFLGAEDKTVVFKSCGPHHGVRIGLDGCGLVGSGGYFRVCGLGEVRGVAYCCGDLSFAKCQVCVGDVIGWLRSECGAADY